MSKLHYICKSEDSSGGFFGTQLECVAWYMAFDGGAYECVPSGEGDAAIDWEVWIKDRANSPLSKTHIKIEAADHAAALVAVLTYMLEYGPFSRRPQTGKPVGFDLMLAQDALKSLITVDEARTLSVCPAGDDEDVSDWKANAETFDAQTLLAMVDLLHKKTTTWSYKGRTQTRSESPFSEAQYAQIKAEING